MTPIDAEQTLTEVHRLRTRTRALAHGGVWFPVAVIAALLLLSITLYAAPFTEVSSLVAPFPFWAGLPDIQRSEQLSYAFWFVLTPAAFALIAWWYRRRARRIGVSIAWRWFVVAGMGALLALAVLAAVPSSMSTEEADILSTGLTQLNVLGGLRTPILPLAAALIVLARAERSVALAATGLWIGVISWWFCAAGPGRLPGWLVWAMQGFQGNAYGGSLGLPGRPGVILIVLALPLVVYATVRGLWRRGRAAAGSADDAGLKIVDE